MDDQTDRWNVLGFKDEDLVVPIRDEPTVKKGSVRSWRVTEGKRKKERDKKLLKPKEENN